LFGQIDQPYTGIGKPRFDAGTFVCQPLYLACSNSKSILRSRV
jgi:hypothetical protein